MHDELCPGCKNDRRHAYDSENEWAYEAEVQRCVACAARDRAERRFSSDKGDTAGIYLVIKRREVVDDG